MKLFIVFTIFLVVLGAVFTGAADPCVCSTEYKPVCGKDGKTYSNRCKLDCAKAQFAHNGKCKKKN